MEIRCGSEPVNLTKNIDLFGDINPIVIDANSKGTGTYGMDTQFRRILFQ